MTGTDLDAAEAKRKLNLPGRCPACGTEGTVEKVKHHINTARCSAHRDGTATSDLHEVWLAAHPPEPETVIIDGGANPAADSGTPPQAAPDPACSGMNHQTGEDCKNRPVPGRDVYAVHLKQEAEQQLGLCPCGQVCTIEQLEQEHIAGCIEHLAAKDDGEPDLRRLYLEHRQEADEREARIRAGAPQVTSWLADVCAAYEARQWEVYGYPDWDSYAAARLPELRKVLADKDERARAIGWLSGAGMSTRAIAQATGTSKTTVQRQVSQSGTATEGDSSGNSPHLSQNGTATEGNDATGTGDNEAPGDPPTGQVLGQDGKPYPARQSATEGKRRKRQRKALAEGRLRDGQGGTSGVTVDVADQDRPNYLSAWDEFRRLAPKLHTMAREHAEPPEQFFEPARDEVKEVWRRTREGEWFHKGDKRLPVALTGDYLVTVILTVLERGKERLGPDADRADLLAQIHKLSAEVERLTGGRVAYDDLVEQFGNPDGVAEGAVDGAAAEPRAAPLVLAQLPEPEAPSYLAGLFDDAEGAGDPA
jgi:hypothetical protein